MIEHKSASPHEFSFRVVSVPATTPKPDECGRCPPPEPAHFEAFIPSRAICWQADTEAGAIGAMLRGVAELARSGALNPANPNDLGTQPIQHAIEILTERLTWQVERRREALKNLGLEFTPLGPTDKWLAAIARDNEIVSALATAIAALARVKDL